MLWACLPHKLQPETRAVSVHISVITVAVIYDGLDHAFSWNTVAIEVGERLYLASIKQVKK